MFLVKKLQNSLLVSFSLIVNNYGYQSLDYIDIHFKLTIIDVLISLTLSYSASCMVSFLLNLLITLFLIAMTQP